jgi:uncharacterized protein
MNRFVWAGRAALLSMVLVIGAPALAGDATLDQVYQAVHAGHLNQARAMMADVLRDHPNSAKAHYVEAEILARQGHAAEAQGELDRAEQLAPGLPFVSPTSVQELRGAIASGAARRAPALIGIPPANTAAARESTFPWGWLLIVVIGGVIVLAIIRARRNAALAPNTGGGTAASYGAPPMAPMGGGIGSAPMGSGIGSGIVGGIVTGAAVGAGMVAGEALAHDLMGRHDSSGDLHRADTPATPADNDLGGQDFGINDGGSWDDGGGSSIGGGGDDWS